VKNCFLFLLFGFFATVACGQQNSMPDITGLWQGTLYNDTTGLYYKYEIGISFNNNKYSGFSHTYFIKDDKEYYGVKKLNIHLSKEGKLIVKDDGLIANNYPEAPAKGIRQTNELTLVQQDSILILDGPYSTNQTKTYNAITGHVRLERKNDFWRSALIPHLRELGETKSLSFLYSEKHKIEAEKSFAKSIINIQKPDTEIAGNLPVLKTDADVPEPDIQLEKKPPFKEKASGVATAKPNADVYLTHNLSTEEESKTLNRETKEIPAYSSEINKPDKIRTIGRSNLISYPAQHVFDRVTLLEQTVSFSGDSLRISLYDNGEVDGDTVSVLMDGKLILAREGLSSVAINKTIYMDPSKDEVVLVMYAENLGKIPPNTGLLVVRDGKSIYEVRFSGDYQKNAAIRFSRKRE